MKTIHEGKSAVDPWWVGRRAKCENCGFEAELERGDDKGHPRITPMAGRMVIYCPCGNVFEVRR